MSLISMHGAWLSFSDAPLLDNAELHIEDNERVCLVGRKRRRQIDVNENPQP
ncbi:ABC transporter ATP-binding protein [Escherichia coli]|uniref:ABC transporter ATP-binding protein n=1 Tax=Escherichia coli TaxID=562 RepID=A0A377CZP4_ECOLX|nr:ABC transporter ATP-binding protein [Escherichia coli]